MLYEELVAQLRECISTGNYDQATDCIVQFTHDAGDDEFRKLLAKLTGEDA